MLNEIQHFATSVLARVLVAREQGQAMVEYSLILGLLSVIALFALTTLGEDVKAALEHLAEMLAAA
jgi:Flp pilus assembly pilin Flp